MSSHIGLLLPSAVEGDKENVVRLAIAAILGLMFTLAVALAARTVLRPYASKTHSFMKSNDTATRKARKLYTPPAGYVLNKDLLYIYTQEWRPKTSSAPLKGVVVLAHGVGEHCGRYAAVAQTLCDDLNCAVVSLDHQGHGKSEGDRLFVVDFNDYVADVRQIALAAKAKYPGVPLFLLCHSMGGLIGIRLLEQQHDLFAGAVISAPALSVVASPTERKLAPVISEYLPHLPMNKVDPNILSHDPCAVDLYCNDPLCTTDGVTARLGCEILNAIDQALAFANEITLPYLLIRGSKDQVTLRPGIVQFHETTKSSDKTFTELTDLYHEIFNERNSPACSLVSKWIKARLTVA